METARIVALCIHNGHIFRHRRRRDAMTPHVREPAVADCSMLTPERVGQEVRHYLDKVPDSPWGIIRASSAPMRGSCIGFHGRVRLQKLSGASYDAVVIIGPSHREFFEGISIPPEPRFATPWATSPSTTRVRREIASFHPSIEISTLGHKAEHSWKFSSRSCNKCWERSHSSRSSWASSAVSTARSSQGARPGRTALQLLFVASSDLSHYHRMTMPCRSMGPSCANIELYRTDAFMDKLERNQAEACGAARSSPS